MKDKGWGRVWRKKDEDKKGWMSLSTRMKISRKDKGWGRVWGIKEKNGWACHLGWGVVWRDKGWGRVWSIKDEGWMSLSSRMRSSMKYKRWGEDEWACHLGWGGVWRDKGSAGKNPDMISVPAESFINIGYL